jgi:multiple sugar transport system permease protein
MSDIINNSDSMDISASDPKAVEKLTVILEKCKETKSHMDAVNAYYRKHGTCKGFPGMEDITAEELESRIQLYDRHPFPKQTLQNRINEINVLEQRIEEVAYNRKFGFLGWEFNGGKVEANLDMNRLQIFFDRRPDEQSRDELVANGFRWTQIHGAWQRPLNGNAIHAAEKLRFIKPKDGKSVHDHQPKPPTKQGRNARLEKKYWGYIFILPFFIAYILFSAYPLITTFYYSVTDKSTFGRSEDGEPDYEYVGLDNFYKREPFDDLDLFLDDERPGFVRVQNPRGAPSEILVREDGSEYIVSRGNEYEVIRNDDGTLTATGYLESGVFGITNYRKAFTNTPLLWVMGFTPQITIALLFAAWFTNVKIKIRGQGFFKVVFYLPNIMTAATIGALFLAFVAPGGIIHQIAVELGFIESKEVIRSIWFTRGSIAAINTWMWFGNSMLILIAAINSINISLFEAARIDGAGGTKVFWKITIPLIKPVLVFTFVQSLVGGFQMYDVPRVLSNSGDASNLSTDGTRTILNSLMTIAFDSPSKDLGLAAAMSVTLFAMTTVCSIIIFTIMKDRSDLKWMKQQKKLQKARRG